VASGAAVGCELEEVLDCFAIFLLYHLLTIN
jgi:hypothetical protein